MDAALQQLITLSNHLGDPALDYVILGEGNTSARADPHSFWVKASGTELRTVDANGFVRVSFPGVLQMLQSATLTDEQIKQQLSGAKVDPVTGQGSAPVDGVQPSVETVLHAICLNLEGVDFVAHTHPTAINALTCAAAFETAVSGRLFPDEIVLGGPAPVVVPYTDPGLPLARKVQELMYRHIAEHREAPRVILMQNHGLIALGQSAQQVENITAMAVKAARVLIGAYALGGPHFMTPAAVARIHTRPDELYRRKLLGE
ncbi:MAG: aldolase [Chloroflexi bacterium HGW-Chloroflexi-1]|nr:MAG: aldolase [Chloroflexi bacterium HGW-Chloroflexi-1]